MRNDQRKSETELLKELIEARRPNVDENAARRLEEEHTRLKASEEKFRNLFQHSNEAIFILDLNGRVLDANQKLLALFGYRPSEIAAVTIYDLVDAAEESRYRSALQALTGEGSAVFEIDLKRKNGQIFPAEVSASTFAIGRAKVVQGVVRNISERKRAEEELRKYRKHLEAFVAQRTDQLEAANKELESFAYSVSHDLRAPLRAMEGFANALLEDYADRLDETGRDYARRVVAAAEHMDILIQDLLSYSRLSRSELKPAAVDLDSVLGEVMHQFSADIEKTSAQIRIERPLPAVMGDHATLVNVLSNLLSNAIKFVEPGVRPRINIRAEETGTRVRLWVEDAGIGIAPEYHDRIFRIFERLQGVEKYPGTGIGLAIVKKGLERMGGQVGVDSAPGRGSKFWIELRLKGF
ncbi:PAS domain S-box protein [candidate division WOR-3 bacterium]|nr:PAS domain S-box protein [candidate division WOR-3 bacterium]